MAETKIHGFTVQERLGKMDVDLIEITPSTTTNACSDGEIIFDNEKVANAVSVGGGTAILQSVTVLDDDDHGTALDLVFFDATSSLGTEGGIISCDDGAVPDAIIGFVSITNYFDGLDWKIAQKTNIGLVLRGDASKDIYMAAVNRSGDAKTYTAAGLLIKLGIIKD